MKPFVSYLTELFLARPSSQSKVFRDESAYVDPDYDWQYVMTPGHAIYARIKDMSFVGHRLVALTVLAVILFWYSMEWSFQLASTAAAPLQSDNSGRSSDYIPIRMIKTDLIANNVVRMSRGATDVTDAKVLPAFIKASIDHLNSTNKLLEPCIQRDSIMSPWVDEKGSAKHLFCKVSGSGNGAPARAFVFALVRDSRGVHPWFGIFMKNGKWTYKTISSRGDRLYVVPNEKTIEPIQIGHTMTSDFPDMPNW